MTVETGAPAPEAKDRLDFVTVTYRVERTLLLLQARSMAQHLDPAAVGRILVIINDEDEQACLRMLEAMRPEWGRLAGRVEFHPGSGLMRAPPRGLADRLERLWVSGPRCAWRHLRDRVQGKPPAVYGWARNSGWLIQQALKIQSAHLLTAPQVVILDSKNFFVAPVGRDTFVDDQGRARVERGTSDKGFGWAKASAEQLGQPLTIGAEDIPPALTPAVFQSADMRRALTQLEQRFGPLECYFARRSRKATEFMLLFLLAGGGTEGWQHSYTWSDRPVNRLDGRIAGHLEQALEEAAADPRPVMSLHRRLFYRLSDTEQALLSRWLLERGLIRDGTEGEALFDD